MPGRPPSGYRPPGQQFTAQASPSAGGGYLGPPPGGIPGGPAPDDRSGKRRMLLIGGAAAAVVVVIGLVIAIAGGAFEGSPTTPTSLPVTSAALGDDFGTGSPTASSGGTPSGSDSASPSDTASSTTYDTTAPTEDAALDTAQQFFVATDADDIDAALAIVCPEYRQDFEDNLPDDEFAFTVDSEASSYDDTTVEDGARQLVYTLEVTVDEGSRDTTLDYSLLLRNIDGETFICGRTYEER